MHFLRKEAGSFVKIGFLPPGSRTGVALRSVARFDGREHRVGQATQDAMLHPALVAGLIRSVTPLGGDLRIDLEREA